MNDDITISPYSNSPSTRGVERIDYGNVTIYKTSVGSMDNNVYLLVDSREPDNSLLIDAATDADHLIHLVEHVGAQVRTIVTTHSHGDHVQALGELLQSFPARHITSSLDAADIPEPADQQLDGGETITFGENITLPTFILRGHTEGASASTCPPRRPARFPTEPRHTTSSSVTASSLAASARRTPPRISRSLSTMSRAASSTSTPPTR